MSSRVLRRVSQSSWIRAIASLAALKIAGGALGVLVAAVAGAGGVALPLPLWVFLLQIGVFGAAGAYLILGARGDSRPLALGAAFLVVATSYALRPLEVLEVWSGGALPLRVLRGLQADAFLPALTWIFFSEFPRALDTPLQRRICRLGVATSVAIGAGLFVVSVVLLLPGEWTSLAWLSGRHNTSQYWTIVYAALLPALPVALWRSRTARIEERRRVSLFLAGASLGAVPVFVLVLLFTTWPAFATWARSPAVSPFFLGVFQILTLSIPATTAYSVLVTRVLDVRVILQKALQYGLARGVVGVAASLPFVWLGVRLYALRHEPLDVIATERGSLALAAALALGITGLRVRRSAVGAVDRVFFREQYDSRQILLELAEASRRAESAEDLARLLSSEIDRALHLESIAVLIADPLRGRLFAPGRALRPIDASSELALLLGTRAEPVSVDLEHADPALSALPDEDRQWLADAAAALVVPLASDSGELVGLLALGAKRSELPFSRDDRRLLAVICAAGATALENRILRAASGGASALRPESTAPDAWDRSAARECVRCRTLHPPDAASCAHCSAAVDPVAIPYRVLGKFQLESRIGAGGMGVVYRAVDLALRRPVAVKTLPRTSPEDSMRLRREARAMAAISHPNLAMIYGAETWRGVPILILELLEGGTLAERIAKGALAPAEVVRLGAVLADVLVCMHGAGILHRDIKPSNVAYTRDGVPKLLDFGLALAGTPGHGSDANAASAAAWPSLAGSPTTDLRTVGVVGTPLYMSPEALRNAPPDPSFDLWSLAVVLFEAIAGRHPFEQESWAATLEAIQRAHPPDLRDYAPACPSAVAALLADCLCAEKRRRPSDARELRQRLLAVDDAIVAPAA